MRYFVRVILKIARLLLEEAPRPISLGVRDMSKSLLEYAQGRLGVFTRHHFRYQRERVSGLLLEATRIRAWVRVAVEEAVSKWVDDRENMLVEEGGLLATMHELIREHRVKGKVLSEMSAEGKRRKTATLVSPGDRAIQARVEYIDKMMTQNASEREKLRDRSQEAQNRLADLVERQCEVLEQVKSRLDEAEGLLLSLGYQRTHVRRYLVERVKFASTLARILSLPWIEIGITREPRQGPSAAATRPRAGLYDHRDAPRDAFVRLARKARLSRNLETAEFALSVLRAVSAGSSFWDAVSRRQENGLSRARDSVRELLLACEAAG